MAGWSPNTCSDICRAPPSLVKNMPGAGHLIGTNAIYASKPDGLTIGTFNTGLIYNQLDPAIAACGSISTKMSWIGKASN